jgi:acetylornithine deacetylase
VEDRTVEELTSLLAKLVQIDSVNPDLVPGGAGEREIAEFVADWLTQARVETALQESGDGRPNVIGRIPGRAGGRSLMLNAHMDTVSHTGMSDALTGRIEGNRLFGRGSYDMKGSLAAIMIAARNLAANPANGDVLITAVTDEEFASIGTRAIVRDYTADAAIVTEPTHLELCVAHKGFVWIEFETEGRAAHGSLPDVGLDAITMLTPILQGIHDLDQRLRSGHRHPLLSTGSIHASLVTGGTELSAYPQSAKVSVERRTIPGETTETIQAEIDQILAHAAANWPNFKGTARQTFVANSYEADESSAIRAVVSRALTDHLGHAPIISGGMGWMDSALLAEAGIPTVILGPTGDGAHALTEWVEIDSCIACAELYETIAREFCS